MLERITTSVSLIALIMVLCATTANAYTVRYIKLQPPKTHTVGNTTWVRDAHGKTIVKAVARPGGKVQYMDQHGKTQFTTTTK